MKVAGIIVEYNPFHQGHQLHIQETRRITQCDLLIAVMSGSFTQRGECAITDKWQRTKVALEQQVDLVVELPFVYACQSADYFAHGAITILHDLGITDLVFGSEQSTATELIHIAKTLTHQEAYYQQKVRHYLSLGHNYASACHLALQDLGLPSSIQPNDLLGLSYVKEIIAQQYPIRIHTIKRHGHFHDTTLNAYSASSLRYALKHHQSIHGLTPMADILEQYPCFFLEDYYPYLRYKLITTSHHELKKIHLMEEGLENLLKKKITDSHDMESFIESLCTKRYTKTRLQRTIVHLLMNNDRSFIMEAMKQPYIRPLGMNALGQQYLNHRKKQLHIPLLTNYTSSHIAMQLEYQAACLLALLLPIDQQEDFLKQERKSIPILQK